MSALPVLYNSLTEPILCFSRLGIEETQGEGNAAEPLGQLKEGPGAPGPARIASLDND